MSGKRTVATVVLMVAAASTASATMGLQRRAVEAGFPAEDCKYCHTFDIDHMRDRARKMGLDNLNCAACHGARLPKFGRDLMNDRGNWLVDEKKRLSETTVDVKWLKDYVPPSPSPKPKQAKP